MNISFVTSIAVMLIGLVIFLVTTKPDPRECGRLMFAIGLLVTLLKFAGTGSLHLN